jgi:peptidyl-tRNA hydrolase
MLPGKVVSQAGHAYVGAYIEATRLNPNLTVDYCVEHPESPGTKVCLSATLSQLRTLKQALDAKGIPNFLVIDSGCKNLFDGKPTVTALGFGPARRDQLPSIVRKLQLL